MLGYGFLRNRYPQVQAMGQYASSPAGAARASSDSVASGVVAKKAKFLQPKLPSSSDKKVHDYTLRWGFSEDAVANDLRWTTASHHRANMMGDPIESAFFRMLLPAIGAKRVLEVGVFTGYTTLRMAQALPEDGKVVALDVADEFVSIGKPYWKRAGVDHKIDLRIQPATVSLDHMITNGEEGTFDFAFIDADKTNYKVYYESVLKLLRPNGIVAIDNVLWSGKVVDETVNDEDTVALREISQHVHADERVEHVLLPMADGVLLARKKSRYDYNF